MKIAPALESESVRSFAGHEPNQDPERTWSFALSFAAFPRGSGPVMFSRCLGSALASGRGRPFSVDSVACFCLSALGPESDRSFAETDGARFKN